jgi:hypothetical protein
MMDCPNVEMRDRLPDLANESLEPAARVLIIAHIAECAACAAEIEIIRETRVLMLAATPRVNVAAIVSALPQHGVRPITSAKSASGRAWGTWRIAAAAAFLAAGLGSYAVLRPDAATVPHTSAVAEAPVGLALTGALADLSDAELDALVKDIGAIEALPSTEVETTMTGVGAPPIMPDSVVRELEIY